MIPRPPHFSTLWKTFFHTVEKFRKVFPLCGKICESFSIVWKSVVAAALFSGGAAWASPFAVSAALTTHAAQPAVRVDFTVPEGHHLFAGFTVQDEAGAAVSPLLVPPPDTHDPDDIEPSYGVSFTAFYQPPAGDRIVVGFQGCKGELCYLPEEVTLSLAAAPVADAAPTAAAPTLADWPQQLAQRGAPRRWVGYADAPEFLAFLDPATAPAAPASTWRLFLDDPAQFYLRRGLLPVLLLILVGGMLLNLTPCVLPMIPINLAIIGAGGADTPRAARFGLGLVYGLGMALVYGALGLVVVLTGSVFGAINSSPVFQLAIAVLFVALALAMFDVWQLDFSRFRKMGGMPGRIRLPAVLVMGGVSALLAGACVAPVLIAVLALAGSLYGQGIATALALPFLLGVGMALPWPLVAAGLAVLPKPGAWMDKVKKAFGVLILLLAAYYGWNAYTALRAVPVVPEGAATATGEAALRSFDFKSGTSEGFAALLGEAVTSGKPILLDFGAHWCKVCKLMDATTLREAAVTAKLADYFAIQILADEPNKPPARDALSPFNIQGYPTFLLYPAP